MAENKQPTKENDATTAVEKEAADKTAATDASQGGTSEEKDNKTNQRSRRSSSSSRRRPTRRTRPEREKSEFEQRIIGIRRVTRVVAGGRRFSFSVAMVVGDRKGRVGVGLGKSTDTALAIDKAVRDAKKSMVKVNFTDDMSVPHELTAKFKASRVEIRPAPGRGLVAGSSVRDVLELAGAQNISAKLLSRSKNKINNARCAIEALAPISKPARVSLVDTSSRSKGPRRRPRPANKNS